MESWWSPASPRSSCWQRTSRKVRRAEFPHRRGRGTSKCNSGSLPCYHPRFERARPVSSPGGSRSGSRRTWSASRRTCSRSSCMVPNASTNQMLTWIAFSLTCSSRLFAMAFSRQSLVYNCGFLPLSMYLQSTPMHKHKKAERSDIDRKVCVLQNKKFSKGEKFRILCSKPLVWNLFSYFYKIPQYYCTKCARFGGKFGIQFIFEQFPVYETFEIESHINISSFSVWFHNFWTFSHQTKYWREVSLFCW